MKKNRIIYLALLSGSFILIYFYGGKIPYALFYAALTLPIFSLAYILIIYCRFKYNQHIDKNSAVKGEKISLLTNITNEDFFLYPYMQISFHGDNLLFSNQLHTENFSLMPHQQNFMKFEIECKYRGRYHIGIKAFYIEDILGIFKLTYNVRESKYITVYPKIVFLERFLLNTNFLSDSCNISNSYIEDMTTVSSIQKYCSGDGLKRIHWKLSAKMNDLYSKRYQSTSQINAVIFLDLQKSSLNSELNIALEDKVIECVVAVTYYCLRNMINIDLIYYDCEVVNLEARNLLGFEEIYKNLSAVSFSGNIPVKDVMDIYLSSNLEKNNIIVFSSNIDYELYNQLYKASSAGYAASFIYVSPASVTGIANKDAEKIISFLPEIGVNTYSINIDDDIKLVLER